MSTQSETFDDRDTDHLHYQGGWFLSGTFIASNVGQTGTLASANDLAASVTFTFPTPAVAFYYYGIRRCCGGFYQICVDCDPNNPQWIGIDALNATDDGKNPPVVLFSKQFEGPPEVHEIILRNQNDTRFGKSQITLDKFVIDVVVSPPPPPPSPSSNSDDPTSSPATLSTPQPPPSSSVSSITSPLSSPSPIISDSGHSGFSIPATLSSNSPVQSVTDSLSSISSLSPSPSPSPSPFHASTHAPVGAIAGGVVGVIFTIGLVLVFIFFHRRRQASSDGTKPSDQSRLPPADSVAYPTQSPEMGVRSPRQNAAPNLPSAKSKGQAATSFERITHTTSTSASLTPASNPASTATSSIPNVSSGRTSEDTVARRSRRGRRELDAGRISVNEEPESEEEGTLPPDYEDVFHAR